MKKSAMKKSAIACLLLAAAGAAQAETAKYQGGDMKWVDDKTLWSDGASETWPDSATDYLIDNGKGVYFSGKTFGGKSLRFGVVGAGQGRAFPNGPNPFVMSNDGIFLARGLWDSWMDAGGAHPIDGHVTVESPAADPFQLLSSKVKGPYYVFRGDLNGAPGVKLLCTTNNLRDKKGSAGNNVGFVATGCLTNYFGELEMGPNTYLFQIGNNTPMACPGTFTLGENVMLRLPGASNTLSIAKLAFGVGAGIRLQLGAAPGYREILAGTTTVTEELTLPPEGPVKIELISAVPYVDPYKTPHPRWPVLRVNRSVREIALDDFELQSVNTEAGAGVLYLPTGVHLELDVDEESGLQTLYVTGRPIKTLQTASTSNSAFDEAYSDYWTDTAAGVPCSSNFDYFARGASTFYVTTPKTANQPDGSYRFAGNRLVLADNAKVVMGGSLPVIEFPDLVMRATTAFLNWGVGRVGGYDFGPNEALLNSLRFCTIRGQIRLCPFSGGWECVSFHSCAEPSSLVPRGYVIESSIAGALRPIVQIMPSDNNVNAPSFVAFAGTNTFQAPIIIQKHGSADYRENGATLMFFRKENLGGETGDQGMVTGIWINDGATLWALQSTLLDFTTRPIYIGHDGARGKIKVSKDQTLALGPTEKIYLAGALCKQGEGTLALGSSLHFCTGNCVSVSAPLRDDYRRVTVEEGALEARSATALNGALVGFRPGAFLVARPPAADASPEFRKYGFVNNLADLAPFDFTTEGNLPRIPLKVELPEGAKYLEKFAVCTVAAAQADAIAFAPAHIGDGVHVEVSRRANEGEGSVTFLASVVDSGLTIFVR